MEIEDREDEWCDNNFDQWVQSLDEMSPQGALDEIWKAKSFFNELYGKVLLEEQKLQKKGLSRISAGGLWCDERL